MNVDRVTDSGNYLSRGAVWPRRVDIPGWISNFDEGADRELAIWLLESLVHINDEQSAQAVASMIRDISSRPEFGDSDHRPELWSRFINNTIISFPLSGPGDATASGYIFGRIARQLGFPEDRILDTEHAVARLLTRDPANLVILDDLAASGTQFCRNWTRPYGTGSQESSLHDLHQLGKLTSSYYLPIVATQAAKSKIESRCAVQVLPSYLLEPDYSALAFDTRLVPSHLRSAIPAFLDKYSERTGRAEYGNAGFGDLALAISFQHGCPNNTLPILQWGGSASKGWRTLFT